MCIYLRVMWLVFVGLMLCNTLVRPAQGQESGVISAIRQNAEKVTAAFSAGKADEVAGMFMPKGELIDEEGVVYQGAEEIEGLLQAFFEQFPGTKLAMKIDSIREVGPVAIEEGIRTMTCAEGNVTSQFRYIAVWARGDSGWKLASFRDFADDPIPTPNEYLQPLAWLVGEWINEGADGRVAVQYRWSDDKNYLLGEFQTLSSDGKPLHSSQRIGWDPAVHRIRSWVFDADGGFAEAFWTLVDDGAVIKSSSVNPDGTTSSATLKVTNEDESRFSITGTDRVVGDSVDNDFEITVVRRPPAVTK